MLEVHRLTKYYGALAAIRALSFDVRPDEVQGSWARTCRPLPSHDLMPATKKRELIETAARGRSPYSLRRA
jgi:hypothetical protein